jgi:hypothetical protein
MRARDAKVGTIKKIVHCSRVVPWSNGPAFSLSNADSGIFKGFRSLHEQLEESIRQSKFDYAIVRAPPLVVLSRDGSKYDLLLTNSDATLSDDNEESRPINELSKDTTSLRISILDLAEAVVHGLIIDSASSVTFTVCEDLRKSALNPPPNEDLPLIITEEYLAKSPPIPEYVSDRNRRSAYYSILSMDDSSMKNSYLIRPAEAYRAQLEEDKAVEKYWEQKFLFLQRE